MANPAKFRTMELQSRTTRGRLAIWGGKAAKRASQLLGRGSGGMIGGTVALKLHPKILAELAAGRETIVITGTNGKSTTTRMVRGALSVGGPVASNIRGDNLPSGVTAALMDDLEAPLSALEVDEMHLPAVADQVRPEVMVLLNLSRDQLDRVGEIGAVEKRIRQAVNSNPQARIIANCDDPLIVSAAWDAPQVTWVAAGSGWGADSASFPRGGGRVLREGNDWWVENTPEFRRPQPQWWVEESDGHYDLVNEDAERCALKLSLPGGVNRANAAMAVAAAVSLGVDPGAAVATLAEVTDVAGRYQRYDVDGRQVHLLLAKNPAGWQEALNMIEPQVPHVVIAVNGQVPDGEDLSWLWDVDFDSLRAPEENSPATARTIRSAGERGADLAVRLDYANIPNRLVPSPLAAIRECPPGPVEVLANYTAFRDLLVDLKLGGYRAEGTSNV